MMISVYLALASSVVPAGQAFICTPVAVWDGDGPIWCAEGPRIRLSGIAAREIDDSCRTGHPCPTATGVEARDGLVKLLGWPTGIGPHGHIQIKGPVLSCQSLGGAGGSRTAAWCSSSEVGDISCAMITGGFALKWQKYWKSHRC